MTEDLEQDRQHHTVASISIATVHGKMPQGEARDSRTVASIGVATVHGKMLEGRDKEEHVQTGLDGKSAERLSRYWLNLT